MDQKSKSPLDIIKDILANVDAKRRGKVTQQDAANQQQAINSGGELVPDYKGRDVYISWDGDGIGNKVAQAEERNDEDALASMSQRIESGQQAIRDFITQNQGTTVQSGGDEGLARINSNLISQLENLRKLYKKATGATLTIGIGDKISECTKARMLGKLSGKDQICYFDENTEKEIELRSQEDNPEAKKLQQGGLIGGPKEEPGAQDNSKETSEEGSQPEEQPDQVQIGDEETGDDESEGDSSEQGNPDREEGREGISEGDQEDNKDTSKENEPAEEEDEKLDLPQGLLDAHAKNKKPESVIKKGNMRHDDEIEGRDYSDHDDPEFTKSLLYLLKHGE